MVWVLRVTKSGEIVEDSIFHWLKMMHEKQKPKTSIAIFYLLKNFSYAWTIYIAKFCMLQTYLVNLGIVSLFGYFLLV